jgi:hypothetical protein
MTDDLTRAEAKAAKQLAEARKGMESAKAFGVRSAFDAHKAAAIEAKAELARIAEQRAKA